MKRPLLLLVDDEVGVRESLKMVFNKGYDLIEADSVETAVDQADRSRPDVVLLDVLMPRADGLQALQRIKTIHPDCAVIMLTGVNSQQLAAKAIDSGAFDFVGKPFDINDLREKVARAIESAAPKPTA
jgi:DNA-binding NtrC family response regulator